VFENRVLRKIFGPKREDITRGWRKLRNEELHDLYSSQNIMVDQIKGMRLAGHVAYVEEEIVLVGNLKKKDHFEDLGRGRRIILKLILKK
jgi:hypothetical protein